MDIAQQRGMYGPVLEQKNSRNGQANNQIRTLFDM